MSTLHLSRTINYTITITHVGKNALAFNESYRRIRREAEYKGFHCFLCNKPFQDGDPISLLFIKNQTNKVACETCGTDIENELEGLMNE